MRKPEPTQEVEFYRYDNIRVTNLLARVGALTYPIGDLESVVMIEEKPNKKKLDRRRWAIALPIYGIEAFFLVILWGLGAFYDFGEAMCVVVPMFIFPGIVVTLVVPGKAEVVLRATGDSGTVDLLRTRNQKKAQQFLNAINEARARAR